MGQFRLTLRAETRVTLPGRPGCFPVSQAQRQLLASAIHPDMWAMTIRQSGAYRHLKVVSAAYSRNRVGTNVQKLGRGCVDCVKINW
jgi:hypothetical protein